MEGLVIDKWRLGIRKGKQVFSAVAFWKIEVQESKLILGFEVSSNEREYLETLASVDDPDTANVVEGYYSALNGAELAADLQITGDSRLCNIKVNIFWVGDIF